MIVSWNVESRSSSRENKLLTSCRSRLDDCIIFFTLQRFIEIINDLELSFKFIAMNRASVTTDKSGEPQKNTLDDDLLLVLSLSSKLFMRVGFPLLELCRFSNLGFPVDGDDLRILGILESFEEKDHLL
jgi:hypothetical protein